MPITKVFLLSISPSSSLSGASSNLDGISAPPLPNKQLAFAHSHSLPLLQQHGDFSPNVLHDEIHLDVVAIITERILKPTPDAVDAVERERDQSDGRHRPPAHVVHERKGQDAAKEREHLFLVNPVPAPLSNNPSARESKRWRRLTGEQ